MANYTQTFSERLKLRERINVKKNNLAITQTLESDKIFFNMQKIKKAKILAEGEGLENLTFYMSADDGNHWEQVNLGEEHNFVYKGLELFTSEKNEPSGSEGEFQANDTNWLAQNFTIGANGPNRDFKLNSIFLRIRRKSAASNYTVNIGIAGTRTNFWPIVPPLVTKSFSASIIPTTSSWVEFDFSDKDFILYKGKIYTIVLYTSQAGSEAVYWRVNNSNTYAGVFLTSSDYGNSWTPDNNKDAQFRIYGRTLPALKYKIVGSNAILKNMKVIYTPE